MQDRGNNEHKSNQSVFDIVIFVNKSHTNLDGILHS